MVSLKLVVMQSAQHATSLSQETSPPPHALATLSLQLMDKTLFAFQPLSVLSEVHVLATSLTPQLQPQPPSKMLFAQLFPHAMSPLVFAPDQALSEIHALQLAPTLQAHPVPLNSNV